MKTIAMALSLIGILGAALIFLAFQTSTPDKEIFALLGGACVGVAFANTAILIVRRK